MNNFEDVECQSLIKKYKLKIEDANFAKGLIPRKVVLDHTRNIHSYIVICNQKEDYFESVYWEKNNFSYSLKLMLAIQSSELDRPIFFIYKDNGDKYKVIEGNEIREAVLENSKLNFYKFIIENSYYLNDIILNLHKEF